MFLDKVIHGGYFIWTVVGSGLLGFVFLQEVIGSSSGWPLAVSVLGTGLISAGVTVYTFRKTNTKADERAVELKVSNQEVAVALKNSNQEVANNVIQVKDDVSKSNDEIALAVAKVKDDVSKSNDEIALAVAQVKTDVETVKVTTFSKLDVIHDLVNGGKLAALRAAVEGNEGNVTSKEIIQSIRPSPENGEALRNAKVRLLEARKQYEEHAKQIADSVVKAAEIKRLEGQPE